MTKWDVQNAVKASRLRPQSRLVMFMLIDAADQATAVVPTEHTLSLTELARSTGLARSTVALDLNTLEDLGWVERDRPTVEAARTEFARTGYRLFSGKDPDPKPRKVRKAKGSSQASPQDGLGVVRGADQVVDQNSREPSPPHGLGSPPHGLDLVRSTDQPSPPHGLDLVRSTDSLTHLPTTPTYPPIAQQAALRDDGTLFDPPPPPPKPETEGQRINRLARTYTDVLPLSSFMAVQAVVRTAVKSGGYSDDQITAGLTRLAADPGRAVTANTLRIAITGSANTYRPYQDPADLSAYDEDL